jgi:hypothetical protein
MRFLYHKYYKLIRGPLQIAQVVLLAGFIVICVVCSIVLFIPELTRIALLLGVAYISLLLTAVVLFCSRLLAKLNDLRYLLSLESGLSRSGYLVNDFFTEGAAGNPSLQLLLLKCLRFCKPQRILELGSGQTTKLLACYHRANPDTKIITL